MKKEYCIKCKKCGEEFMCVPKRELIEKDLERAAYYHICDKESKLYKVVRNYFSETDETESELEIEVRSLDYFRMLLKHESIMGIPVRFSSRGDELIVGVLGKAIQSGFNPNVQRVGILEGMFVRYMGLESFAFSWDEDFIKKLIEFSLENNLIIPAKEISIDPAELTNKSQYELTEKEIEETDEDSVSF